MVPLPPTKQAASAAGGSAPPSVHYRPPSARVPLHVPSALQRSPRAPDPEPSPTEAAAALLQCVLIR